MARPSSTAATMEVKLSSARIIGGGLGHGGAGAHGDTNLGSLESGSVVDTVSGHGGNFLHLLQILDNLGLVERLDTGEHSRVGTGGFLLSGGQIVKFTSRVCSSL